MLTDARPWWRRLLPGIDDPAHRDWLVWLAVAITVAMTAQAIRADGWADLAGVPLGFLIVIWLLATIRNFVRGFREG